MDDEKVTEHPQFVTDPEKRARQIEADEAEKLTQALERAQATPEVSAAPPEAKQQWTPAPTLSGPYAPSEGRTASPQTTSSEHRNRQFAGQLFNPDSADWTQH
ncbi:hypothetical protein [Rathayibacter sp. AY1C9]|uniref:hypothetical protein n=1 Tax=Rathayibacter sp. AY1C9 TaxID=2080541 RepID=UPI0011B0A3CA|nr:hypothetical protein [Rathayibacter sp. AY1C9]